MGGSVSVTIREENGKEHRMCRWTNVLPWFINNIRLLNKDVQHIQKYLGEWYGMRRDYEEHKKDRHFKYNMTDVYAPYPFLAPQGYGLVVVDMLKNHILSYQDYSNVGYLDGVSIQLDTKKNEDGSFTMLYVGPEDKRPKKVGKKIFNSDDDTLNAVRFREFFEAGKILRAKDYDNKKLKEIKIKGKSFDEVVEFIEKHENIFFEINMSPYTIIKYHPLNLDEAVKMREKIQELGFVLSGEEKRIWDGWIKEL